MASHPAAKRLMSRRMRLWLHYRLVQLRGLVDRGDVFECNICGKRASQFAAFNARPNAMCPRCFSLERHRLLWAWITNETQLLTRPYRLLHFAPERSLWRRLKLAQAGRYVTADLMVHFMDFVGVRPDKVMSVTDIAFADASFDVVICNHVLQQVPDDRRAMREIHRVLAPGGWAVLLVPTSFERKETIEGDSARFSTPEVAREYAHQDYVRRLREAGFDEVELIEYASHVAPRHRVNDEPLYIARKSALLAPVLGGEAG